MTPAVVSGETAADLTLGSTLSPDPLAPDGPTLGSANPHATLGEVAKLGWVHFIPLCEAIWGAGHPPASLHAWI